MAIKTVDWLIRAGEERTTRFHTYDGDIVSARGIFDLARVLPHAAVRKFQGRRPTIPWIPYPAIREIEKILQPGSRVLEFGSGMSTIWLARLGAYVDSRESDAAWFARVSSRLSGLDSVDVKLFQPEDPAYWQLGSAEAHSYDLVIVDGIARSKCAATALTAVRLGGYIYLDNVDNAVHDGDYRGALDTLSRAAGVDHMTFLVGFPPGQLTVTKGVLLRMN